MLRHMRPTTLLALLATTSIPTAALAGDDWSGESGPADSTAAPSEKSSTAGSQGQSDHDALSGHFGLGYLGARFVPAATLAEGKTVVVNAQGDAVLNIGTNAVTVPVFGARYWFGRRLGLDLGLGFNLASGGVARDIPNPDPAQSRTTDDSAPSTKAFVGHLAVPISLDSISHLNVLLLPEIDVGVSGSTYTNFEVSTSGEGLDLKFSGLLVGAGARLGAELGWGFIGLPQISLQASFGLRFEYRRRAGTIGDAKMVVSGTEFGTSWYNGPWDTLAGSMAVFYYF
jgi:hypothetical protein